MALKVTVDVVNKLIIANFGVTGLNVKIDIYSDLKEDWNASGTDINAVALAGFKFPMRSSGGERKGTKFSASDYFIDAGWRIRPHEADHDLTLDGNLFSDATPEEPLVTQTLGTFTVLAQQLLSVDGLSLNQIAIDELHKMRGLDAANPWAITDSSHVAGAITQSITDDGLGTTTVQRT